MGHRPPGQTPGQASGKDTKTGGVPTSLSCHSLGPWTSLTQRACKRLWNFVLTAVGLFSACQIGNMTIVRLDAVGTFRRIRAAGPAVLNNHGSVSSKRIPDGWRHTMTDQKIINCI